MIRKITLTLILIGLGIATPLRAREDTTGQDRNIAIQVFSERGRDFARLQDWKKSGDAYTEALRRAPDNPDNLFGLGYALHRQGDFQGARLAFQKALKSDPEHADATLWLGMTLLEQKALDNARKVFQKLLGSENIDPRAYYGLASVHESLFKKQDSAQEKYIALKYFEQYVLAAKRRRKGTEYLHTAKAHILELTYGEQGHLFNRALESYQRGDYVPCDRLLNRILKLDPQFQKAHYLKAVLYRTKGSPLFEADFTNSIKTLLMAPDEPEARYLLGSIYRLLGKEDLAKENIAVAVRLCPDFQKALNLQGALYYETGDSTKAIQAYQRSLDINPSNAEGRMAKLEKDLLKGSTQGPLVFTGNPNEKQDEIEALGIVKDAYLSARLNAILERTVRRNRFPYLWEKYSLKIINSASLQAYSLPGGHIYVNIGLIRYVTDMLQDSEDVLAFIIAHEIAHIERDHVIDQVRYVSALDRRLEGFPRARMILADFRRSDEWEADCLGTHYAYIAGFDPYAGIRFLKSMIKRGDFLDDDGAAILEERLQRLQHCLGDLRRFRQSFREGVDRLSKEDYLGAQMSFEHFLAAFPGNPSARNNLAVAFHKQALCCRKPAHWWKASDIEPLGLRAIQQTQRSDTGTHGKPWCGERARMAERQFKILLGANPQNEVALNNLANLYQDMGRADEAKTLYDKALSLNSNYSEARNNYGVLLCTRKEYTSGIEQLESAILSQQGYLPAYYNLGKAYFELQNDAAAIRFWKQYLNQDRSRSGWVRRAERHSAEALDRLGRKDRDEESEVRSQESE